MKLESGALCSAKRSEYLEKTCGFREEVKKTISKTSEARTQLTAAKKKKAPAIASVLCDVTPCRTSTVSGMPRVL